MFGFGCSNRKNDVDSCCNSSKTKKQQAIADREIELIELAKELVKKQGFSNFTMDKLTAQSSYSKGTIYNHFCSKEDVILALCILSLKKESSMLMRALTFEGTTREKVMAMHTAYRIYVLLEPVLSDCVMTARTPWVLEKASSERVKELNRLESQVINEAGKLVQKAVEVGDLQFGPGLSSDAIVFANWSVAFGSNAFAKYSANSFWNDKISDPFSVLQNSNLILDGLKWKPLSSEWDYRKTCQRVEKEIFTKELAYLESSVC